MRVLCAALILAALGSVPAPAADPLSSLRFLVGTWDCTYQSGKERIYYRATYAYDLNNNWLRLTDAWKGGGSDTGMITYEPKRHGWTTVVIDGQRSAVVFRGNGSNPNHVVYRSVYPDATLSEVFDRTSPTRYTVDFTQSGAGPTRRSADVCVKK